MLPSSVSPVLLVAEMIVRFALSAVTLLLPQDAEAGAEALSAWGLAVITASISATVAEPILPASRSMEAGVHSA